jgi:hypothetical protein
MCFYRDTQTIINKNRIAQIKSLHQQRPQAPNESTAVNGNVFNPFFAQKKKDLDKIVPGLFDELCRYGQIPTNPMPTPNVQPTSNVQESIETPLQQEREIPFDVLVAQNTPNFNLSTAYQQPFALNNFFNNQLTSLVHISSQLQMDTLLRDNIFNMLVANSQVINELTQDLGQNLATANLLASETKTLKHDLAKEVQQNQQSLPKVSPNVQQNSAVIAQNKKSNYNPTATSLFRQLCGNCENLPYALVLEGDLPNPIFRERNIKFKVKLVRAIDKSPVLDHGKIFVQITLHTWELPSNMITRNKIGNKVIHGETEREVKNGEVIFDKIQINEVTSKFINGYVAVVISPKRPNNYGMAMNKNTEEDLYETVGYDDIKPLMLEKVIVKSKKKKYTSKAKKEATNDSDE